MEDKWYNSDFGRYMGYGIGLMFIALGVGSCQYLDNAHKTPKNDVPQTQEMKIDGHNVSFYTLDKKMAVTEVDKEPILEFIKKH